MSCVDFMGYSHYTYRELNLMTCLNVQLRKDIIKSKCLQTRVLLQIYCHELSVLKRK
ncbi:unnamed protein product [Nezara viridula]|uniref:Uncharacterized protein n=1 Tax=Nezara viridula TaxID=85310 RepID=A0A9P0HQB2_NEZVI|nr:unnamed protein product [Nezara viridula]